MNPATTRAEQGAQLARNGAARVGPSVGGPEGGPPGPFSGGECASVAVIGRERDENPNPSPPVERATEAPLGSITGYCPGGINPAAAIEPQRPEASCASLDRLRSGYELRARLRPYAVDARIAKCGRVVHCDPEVLTEELADGTRRARWVGVCLCNRAGCPVCARVRARKLGEQIERCLSGGGRWRHVIVTVPHRAGEAWADVYERVLVGVRAMTHGLAGRVLAGIVEATIRSTESTWSVRNGWHVHCHLLWRVRRPLLAEEEHICRQQWAAATGASEEHGFKFGAEFRGDLDKERRDAAKYLTKVVAELAGAGEKEAHGEHFELAELYQRAATGEPLFVDLVREYQRSTRGRRIYQLDRRASAMRDAAPPLPETEVLRSWTTWVDRRDFSALARVERLDAGAIYLPLEVAARCRGDPWEDVDEAIGSLLRPRKAAE